MDLMIIVKWLTDFTGKENSAPSVITTMINMALAGGEVEKGISSLIGSSGTQQGISILFLILALICVPVMLFVKPILLDK